MLDAALSFLGPQVAECTVTGHRHRQFGTLSTTRKPTGNRFAAGEGHLMLAVMTDRQFEKLLHALGRPEILDDIRFKDWPARIENQAALREIIEAVLASADAKTWEARLTKADVPCASIWTIGEIVHHPQLAHRDVLQTVDSAYGALTLVGSGFRLAEGGGSIERAPPLLGEHTDQILAEAGYAAGEIESLRREGVV
jgi:crotonobetainyl-CoA:carnitine CoA-transferase CaiB-like acyl-CoA transferase